jgi:hypothetical protein
LNFHSFADSISNYVVILKLPNDNILAAYSQNPLIENTHNNGPGFFGNLSNGKIAYVETGRNGSRTTMYDPFYIIFGND